jgi:YfiH family protein
VTGDAAHRAVALLEADWPAPRGVRAVTTQRVGGVSEGPYASLNLGSHVGDDPRAVETNRKRVARALALPAPPLWLQQRHGAGVCHHAGEIGAAPPEADAAVALAPGRVLAVLTADCLPVVFARRDGTGVAVAHAGWRGLAAGVLEAAGRALAVPGAEVIAWLGPAIGPAAFEVGPEVRRVFLEQDPGAEPAFTPNACGRWQADLYQLARLRLERLGLAAVAGGGYCTYTDSQRWYSARRANPTGRMATLAWIERSR